MDDGILPQIENFLCFSRNSDQDFKVLYNYTILTTKFDSNSLKAFYCLHSNTSVLFDNERTFVSEILYNCEPLLNQIPDDLYAFILCNMFISKNSFEHSHIISDEQLKIFHNKAEWMKNQEIVFFLPKTDKIIKLINNCLIPPFIVELDKVPVKITGTTLKYLIDTDINIPELMNCECLDNDSINLISEQIIKNQYFRKKCEDFIECQGILNPTIQLIASLLNISKKSRISDFKSLHTRCCGTHFSDVFIPISQFKSIGSILDPEVYLHRLEVYYIYLLHKKSIEDDLDQISIALSTSQDLLETNLHPQASIEMSLTPLNDDFNIKIKPRSITSLILDLVFKSILLINFESYSFRNISELSNEPYFDKIIKVCGRDIIESKIQVPMNEYLTNISIILEFLKGYIVKANQTPSKRMKFNDNIKNQLLNSNLAFDTTDTKRINSRLLENNKIEFNEINCSLDTFSASDLFSSLDHRENQNPNHYSLKSDEITNNCIKIPLTEFKDCPWLLEIENSLLIDRYFELYDINEILGNILVIENPTGKLREYLIQIIDKITSKIDRLNVFCKYELELDLSSYNDQEIRKVLAESLQTI